ncbi:phosphatidylglycerophosphatase A [Planococcus maritimus]|uniref:Phosphatidylglycerophosphatase A n=1 Tax=Planococcus maritimus TaxID=192421 RepID=A0A7D7MFJ1_PLAMR|nr:phosphatidylglycerophosphatase A [Planococcus maritimus]KYG59143.1 phosphatidylglycerophosphatase A [Planococcus maritimus]OED32848.1 phosphatidylglycerophosphatase A [Planococcus maritimus]QMT16471.1 phosphatidylglycerophosphatase A [Planococcus maritimus]
MDGGHFRVHSEEVTKATHEALERRGVKIQDIAEIVLEMQLPFNEGLTIEHCAESVESVLRKREMQHALLVGIELDELAEQGKLSQPIQQIIGSDEGLFGVDEMIGLGAVLTYGSIAVTTFGHLDKNKTGIIHKLDTKYGGQVHTFLDDLVSSVAACASARIAHRTRDLEEEGRSFEDLKPEETTPETHVPGAEI